MNVLSLFDGMSCGQLALEKAGIAVTQYYASEVDKHAIKVAKANYPDMIHLGDVRGVTAEDLPQIDLLIGGSPCQGFSFAGKQLNFEDPRSALFFEYVRLLKTLKPRYFMLENVRMKKEYQDVISEQLGVEPIMINSSLLSAQNRVRLYWTNIPNIVQPEDTGSMLKDVLEVGGFVTDREKSYCLDANYFKGGNLKSYFEKHRRQLVFSAQGLAHVATADLKGSESLKRVYHEAGKAPTLTAHSGGNTEAKIVVHPASIVGRRINDRGVRDDYNKDVPVTQCLQVKSNPDKSGCLTTVEKDNVLSLNKAGRYPDAYNDPSLLWRKLTPLECERLQTVPDGYTDHVSNTQRYRMLGNGWTVDVISHIFNNIETYPTLGVAI